MNQDKLSSILSRLLFVGAFVTVGAAISDKIANFFGYTFLWRVSPGRLLEFAAVLLVFTIALLLRQVRDQLRRGSPSSG